MPGLFSDGGTGRAETTGGPPTPTEVASENGKGRKTGRTACRSGDGCGRIGSATALTVSLSLKDARRWPPCRAALAVPL